MLSLLRLFMRMAETVLGLPVRLGRFFAVSVAFNPRLGPLRHMAVFALGYVVFALLLVYVVAPIRGIVGAYYLGDKLRYDAERWVATAIYDTRGSFVGTFDPRLDSRRDVNYTDKAIEIGDYVANPDHKSIPVREAPDHYWRCLTYHEDRYIGQWMNPYGIDLVGVLKIPYSSVKRTLASKRPSLGVGGSTLPMQLARVIYKTPPSSSEGGFTKLRRKLAEWWIAPVIYHELTRGGDDTPLRQWTANHIWLAQRTGGSPLHGVEVTSRIVFGKEAKDLSIAEQYVLASAVNKPIILLEGNEKLNEVRLDRWRYITEVRAATCAQKLITDEAEQKKVMFELVQLAGGPPDPRVKPKLQEALETYAPTLAKRAHANPVIRANALMPAARFGLREEMKQTFGTGWRESVRGVTTTFDAVENLAFNRTVKTELAAIDAELAGKINPGFTLDPDKVGADRQMPHVVVAAANHKGEIVRYYESHEVTPYYGSPYARDTTSGQYVPEREPRMIASTGKMLVAIGVANEHRDTTETLYLDTEAPAAGLETCARHGTERRGRKALVSFACSLNNPLITRAAQLGQAPMKRLIDGFGFNMPPVNADGEGTPPSTAAVLGLISGSPRRVHHMASVVLAALTEQGGRAVKPPTLVRTYDFVTKETADAFARDTSGDIVPNKLIKRDSHALLKALLQGPLCYSANGTAHGTLKTLNAWCAEKRADLRLHFAKTGTMVNEDPNNTVDTWTAGGLQFTNGAAYSYVVMVGTGSAREPWARSVHAAQMTRLINALLLDLEAHSRKNPAPGLLPPRPATPVASAAPVGKAAKGAKGFTREELARTFGN